MIPLLWLVLTGCVDETGYGDPTPGSGDDQAAEDAAVDLWYTADEVLGTTPVDVTVLALAGTLGAPAVVELSVGGDGAVTVPVVDGGFVGVVSARLGDTVDVIPDRGEALSLRLDDDLGDVAAPTGAPETADSDAPAGDDDAPRVVDGEVDVGDGALGFEAPYLAWIEARGVVVRVGVGDDATLPAADGDRLCAAQVDGAGHASVRTCITL